MSQGRTGSTCGTESTMTGGVTFPQLMGFLSTSENVGMGKLKDPCPHWPAAWESKGLGKRRLIDDCQTQLDPVENVLGLVRHR